MGEVEEGVEVAAVVAVDARVLVVPALVRKDRAVEHQFVRALVGRRSDTPDGVVRDDVKLAAVPLYFLVSISTVPFSNTYGAGLSLPHPNAVWPGGSVKLTGLKGPSRLFDTLRNGWAAYSGSVAAVGVAIAAAENGENGLVIPGVVPLEQLGTRLLGPAGVSPLPMWKIRWVPLARSNA